MPFRTLSIFVALCLAAGACLVAVAPASAAESVERELVVMGTRARVLATAPDRASALEATERVLQALEAADERLSTWGEASELLAFERGLARGPVRIGGALERELEAAWECAVETDGAFDPTIGRLVDAWGLRTGGRIPDSAGFEAARRDSGFGHVTRSAGAWTSRRAGLELEEGGFGKGAALDSALAALDGGSDSARGTGDHAEPGDLAVTRLQIDLGGQLVVRGLAESIDIADPERRDRVVARVRIENGSIATSGNSEKGLIVGGRRIGHLLDPRTGRPAEDFGSVTVLAPSGLEADCLSTGLFVLGPDEALERAERWPDVEVVVVRRRPEGSEGPSVSWSSGLEGRVERIGVSSEGWAESSAVSCKGAATGRRSAAAGVQDRQPRTANVQAGTSLETTCLD